MDSDYVRARRTLLDDPTASHWLKRAVCALEERDPLDAKRDAACLATIAGLRTQEVLRGVREQFPNPLSTQCHSCVKPLDKRT